MDDGPEATTHLLKRLHAGDCKALTELFATHRDRLRRIVALRLDVRLQGRIDASDVLQDAFIDVANHQAATNGGDRFFAPYGSGPFASQGLATALNGFGNTTRYNPKLRTFPSLTENMSVTRVFPIHESIRLEFRAEAFNLFNRVRFGTGPTQLQDPNFGRLTSASDLLNTPRQLQLALKLYF